MILYHAISTYQLLEMIIYRMQHSEKENSVLMITDTLRDKFPIIEKYGKYFSDVWVYDINLAFPPKISFQNVIANYFDAYFASHEVAITDFEEINLACGHYYFGHYLVDKNIPFVYFEDAAGMLSRPDILVNIEERTRPYKCTMNIKKGLYDGTALCITSVVCNVEAQEEGVLENYDNIIDFNVIKQLIELDQETQDDILDIFIEKMTIPVNDIDAVVLTQHFANLNILPFEGQKEIYKLFADYFYQGKKVLLKPHPDDVMYYEKIWNNASIIKERFPSEFLPILLEGGKPEISTISSTAIKNYYGCDYDVFELTTDFEKSYQAINRYYIALELTKALGCNSLEVFGCDKKMLKGLIDRNSSVSSLDMCDEGEVVFVDDFFDLRFSDYGEVSYNEELLTGIQSRLAEENKIFVFLNSKECYTYFHQDEAVLEKIVPVKLTFSGEEQHWSLAPSDRNETQYFYVYAKDGAIRNKVRSFNMSKKLNNAKQDIKVGNLSDFERDIYEAKIRALEERLKYYINLENARNGKEQAK